MENLLTAIRHTRPWHGRVGLAVTLVTLLAAPGAAFQEIESSYAFIRLVEGDADLLAGSTPPAIEATPNYPVQVGDQIRVSPAARLEVVLPDRSRLRLDHNTDLRFERIARSLDTGDEVNQLRLLQGRIQASLVQPALDPRSYRVETANATLYFSATGDYQVFTDGKSWTQVIVRTGYCEVVTESLTQQIGPGQEAIVDGQDATQLLVRAAPPRDELEHWAMHLQSEIESPAARVGLQRAELSPHLAYAASPLLRHGRWIGYGATQVWRPHVPRGWRPYHSGWWIYTPTGLTWISTEPWGWVTYHYGYWGHAGEIGWVWHPGNRYTPGAVYWYWGPTHIGWIPTGHYSPLYRDPLYALPPYGAHGGRSVIPSYPYKSATPHGAAMRLQAGGDLSHWRDWTFAPYDRFGYRDSHRYLKTGAELAALGALRGAAPTGYLTTDTRALTPNLWQDPRRVLAIFESTDGTPPNPRRLSRLGAAALAGPGSISPRPDSRLQSVDSNRGRIERTWSSEVPTSLYRRDGRSAIIDLRGTRSTASAGPGAGARRIPGIRSSASGIRSMPRFTGPSPPGSSPLAIGGSRSSQPPRGAIRGPARSGPPGRLSGAGGKGRSMGGRSRPPGSSTSGGGGSG